MALEFAQRELVWIEIRAGRQWGWDAFKADVRALDAFKLWMAENKVVPARNPVSTAGDWVGGFTKEDATRVLEELTRRGIKQVVL